jgi:signal transduction histidine kinase/ligand-binding sensor domain-containing protein
VKTMTRSCAQTSVMLLLAALLFCSFAEAGQRWKIFEQFTRRNGIASNIVHGAAKDARGFLWISTPAGIQRFDGSMFQSFRYDPAEDWKKRSTNYSYSFVLDSNRILFFEFSGRIDQYDYRTGLLSNFSRTASLDSIASVSAFRDSHGRVWIATNDGLVLLDESGKLRKTFIIASDLPRESENNRVNIIREDHAGRLWLAMFGKGIMLFDPSSEKFSAPFIHSLNDIQVHDLSLSSDGKTVWSATGGIGVLKIDAVSFRITNITKKFPAPFSTMNAIPSLHLYKDSILWVGTLNGVIEYDLAQRSAQLHSNDPDHAFSLSNNTILFIADFHDDILWFGTQKGLNKLSVTPPRFRKLQQEQNDRNSLSTNAVNHQWDDPDGNTWFATARGLSIRSRTNGHFHHYALLHSGDVNVIHIAGDRDNNVWIGTWGTGLMRTRIPKHFTPGDPLRFDRISRSGFVKKTIVEEEGDLISVTWGGGIQIIPNRERNAARPVIQTVNRKLFPQLSSDHISDISSTNKGKYWIVTGNGLQQWNRIDGSFLSVFADSLNLSDKINDPTYIVKDSLNTVWVGTQAGLVSIAESQNGMLVMKKMIHQSGMFVYQPQIDRRGKIWFGAPNSRLFEFDPETEELRSYDLTYEINGYEFNFGHSGMLRNGDLVFCGSDGVLSYSPDKFRTVGSVPMLYRTSILIEGVPLFGGKDHSDIMQLQTPHDKNDLSISYAALSFERPERIQYEYMLEGANNGWTATGNRGSVSFANLSPGSYRFRVRAANDNRSWSTEAAPLSIVVMPPWWETVLFRSAVVFILAALSALFLRRKFSQLKQEQERQQQFSKQLIDSQEAERKRIASELHDGIGQNLLIISNTLQLYLGAKRKKKEEIEQMTELTKETVREIRNISSNLHPHQLERLGLKRAVLSMVESAGKTSMTKFTVTVDDGVSLKDAQQEIHLFRIIQEIVNNVIKHAQAPSAEIALARTNSDIHITARDNGKGFDPNGNISDGLGMTSLKERTRLLNGTITVRSASNMGTEITITIPLHG